MDTFIKFSQINADLYGFGTSTPFCWLIDFGYDSHVFYSF